MGVSWFGGAMSEDAVGRVRDEIEAFRQGLGVEISANELDALRAEVAGLRAEILAVRAEVARLSSGFGVVAPDVPARQQGWGAEVLAECAEIVRDCQRMTEESRCSRKALEEDPIRRAIRDGMGDYHPDPDEVRRNMAHLVGRLRGHGDAPRPAPGQ